MSRTHSPLALDQIELRILQVRGENVILDRDLAVRSLIGSLPTGVP